VCMRATALDPSIRILIEAKYDFVVSVFEFLKVQFFDDVALFREKSLLLFKL